MDNPETKKPDPATTEQKLLEIDYEGDIKFFETPKQDLASGLVFKETP